MQIVGNQVPLAQVIQSQMTQNSTNSIAWQVDFNPNMVFQIKVLKDKRLCKHVP